MDDANRLAARRIINNAVVHKPAMFIRPILVLPYLDAIRGPNSQASFVAGVASSYPIYTSIAWRGLKIIDPFNDTHLQVAISIAYCEFRPVVE
jgi:hypothetical protein